MRAFGVDFHFHLIIGSLTGLSFSAVSHRVHLCRHKAIEDSIELAAKLNSVSAKLFLSITMAALLAQSPT